MTSTTTTSQDEFEKLVREEELIQASSLPLDQIPSCTTLFDKWASCFALGPQARNIYRYGSLNDCAGKLDDFKFCLSMKALSADERRDVWIRRRAEQMAAKRSQIDMSSESVWEMRKNPLIDPALADHSFPKVPTTSSSSSN